ncbi:MULTISPECIES: septal ring lytic transglycosylase RlpA family protein [Massilia]|uniref:Endolytic peptidoglycan transglycosylase RlpA n=1 Tax=Massilia aurea TaxID=373040 RepID=A0A422QIX8_9BURK|nr:MULTISPECIES: septal ring lytic transglycosylase RlpA family protein [Massilia]MDY0965518.1 septal ring lytic transglycosylase RlpA family protein [Massilia sp. CFBP9026]RNF29927.1 lipoprotein [Massilia aurea]
MGVRTSFLAVIPVAILVSACSSTGEHKRLNPFPWPHKPTAKHGKAPQLPAAKSGRGGYYKDDGPGDNIPDGLLDVPDAVVKAEPFNKWTSRPYTVLGKTYTPLGNDVPYSARGVSTWYGVKFHGQRTASGELYDMYKMTAAHPTLPIPSYVRVTSLDTGNSVVVRINDRGPFHASRIIDVSYTAALKLGLLGKGSHEVEIERLFPGDPIIPPAQIAAARREVASIAQSAPPEIEALMLEDRIHSDSAALVRQAEPAAAESAPASAPTSAGRYFIQFGAYGRAGTAEAMGEKITNAGVELGKLEVVKVGSLNRLYGGPYASRAEALEAMRALPASLGFKPIVVQR